MTSFLTAGQLRDQRLELGGSAGQCLRDGVPPGTALVMHGGPGARWGALEALAPSTHQGRAVVLLGLDDLPASALEAAGWSLAHVAQVSVPTAQLAVVASNLADVVDVLVVSDRVVDVRWPRILGRVRRRRGFVVVLERACSLERHRVLAAAGSIRALEVASMTLVEESGLPREVRVSLRRSSLVATTPRVVEVAG